MMILVDGSSAGDFVSRSDTVAYGSRPIEGVRDMGSVLRWRT